MATRPDSATAGLLISDEIDDAAPAGSGDQFEVRLENFTGPFDLLLSLITKHRLDITEIALAQVTDDFLAHVRGRDWPLEEASAFLVVAATLLDLKAARLLPAGEVEDAEDIARLEARDLLFARLLQYRAYKEVADTFRATLAAESGWHARNVTLEPWVTALLPDLIWTITPQGLAELAAGVIGRKPAPTEVGLGHLHAPVVSVREQAAILIERLRRDRSATFRTLTADAANVGVVVARFMALLQLFRDSVVAFDQMVPLGDLTVRWTGTLEGDLELTVTDEDGADDDQPS